MVTLPAYRAIKTHGKVGCNSTLFTRSDLVSSFFLISSFIFLSFAQSEDFINLMYILLKADYLLLLELTNKK